MNEYAHSHYCKRCPQHLDLRVCDMTHCVNAFETLCIMHSLEAIDEALAEASETDNSLRGFYPRERDKDTNETERIIDQLENGTV